MKAIFTKYHGPGNVRGSRISANDGENRVSVSRDCALSISENHDLAARALCKKMQWTGTLVRGDWQKGFVYVWVWPGKQDLDTITIAEVQP